jgi:hypothetical protein
VVAGVLEKGASGWCEEQVRSTMVLTSDMLLRGRADCFRYASLFSPLVHSGEARQSDVVHLDTLRESGIVNMELISGVCVDDTGELVHREICRSDKLTRIGQFPTLHRLNQPWHLLLFLFRRSDAQFRERAD